MQNQKIDLKFLSFSFLLHGCQELFSNFSPQKLVTFSLKVNS